MKSGESKEFTVNGMEVFKIFFFFATAEDQLYLQMTRELSKLYMQTENLQ